MPRSLWSGSLSFGLVNVPVALFSGVKDTDLHFRQLHEKDHTPVETRRFCADEDVEVPYDEAKGILWVAVLTVVVIAGLAIGASLAGGGS